MSYYKRNLPHIQPSGYAFFVTLRLDGTLPIQLIEKLKREYETEFEKLESIKNIQLKKETFTKIKWNYFLKYEKYLDSSKFGRKWLSNNNIAQVLVNTYNFYNNKRYDLICYTVMSNHSHIILLPRKEFYDAELEHHIAKGFKENTYYFLTNILRDIKKYSAKESNKILIRKGQFWHHESYDHVIRNKKELLKLVEYVLNNPVKVGLCKHPDDWEWNYYNPKFL